MTLQNFTLSTMIYISFDDENEIISDLNTKFALLLRENSGDISDTSNKCIVAHARNCMGSWGAGIASNFRHRYSDAFNKYKEHCNSENILGTCLILPLSESSVSVKYIACLFTSYGYGKQRDSIDKILTNTKMAIEDMIHQIENYELSGIGIRMNRINSGYFRVPWSKTRDVLSKMEFVQPHTINVLYM